MEFLTPELCISLAALITSAVALIYTAMTYWLKQGHHIRGTYSEMSSIACEDNYFSSVTLENLKDRAVVIFKIFMRIGHNYYIQIDDFEDAPLILKPFEIFKKEYDPIDFYSINLNRIRMNELLKNDKIKRTIVLSTSEGKYVVKSRIGYWNPAYEFFLNHMTAVIYPMRASYKGRSYGEHARFIIEIKFKDNKEEIIPIYPKDYQTKQFKRFQLTKDSLQTRESLEAFLYEQIGAGTLNCEDISVHDIAKWRIEAYELEEQKTITAKYYS